MKDKIMLFITAFSQVTFVAMSSVSIINGHLLLIGITGQDGSYLAEFLLEKGYEVHGIIRRSSMINTYRIDHIFQLLGQIMVKFML